MSNRNVPVPVRTEPKGSRAPARQGNGAYAVQAAPGRQDASGATGNEAFGAWPSGSNGANPANGADPSYGANPAYDTNHQYSSNQHYGSSQQYGPSQPYGANPSFEAGQAGPGAFDGQAPYGGQMPPINVYNTNNYYDGRPYGMGYYPYRNKWIALLLCFFLGVFGVHRFYVILILCNAFRDKARMPLVG